MELSEENNRRSLTEEGIQLIKNFLVSKGVYAVDLQIELIDHFTILTEEELNGNRDLTFTQALNEARKRTGQDSGLRKLVKSQTKAIDKYWKRRIRLFMKGYFQWPKIVIFFLIFLFFFSITYNHDSLYNKQSLYTAIGFTCLTSIAFWFIIWRRVKSNQSLSYHPLYTYQSFHRRLQFGIIINVTVFLQLWVIFPNWFPDNEWPAITLLILMSCISAYELLLAHAFETRFQFWIQEELENKYPEHMHLIRS